MYPKIIMMNLVKVNLKLNRKEDIMLASEQHIVKIFMTPNELRGLADKMQKKIDITKIGQSTLVEIINTSDVFRTVQIHFNQR